MTRAASRCIRRRRAFDWELIICGPAGFRPRFRFRPELLDRFTAYRTGRARVGRRPDNTRVELLQICGEVNKPIAKKRLDKVLSMDMHEAIAGRRDYNPLVAVP